MRPIFHLLACRHGLLYYPKAHILLGIPRTMQSSFEAKVYGGGGKVFSINVPTATAEVQGLKNQDVVRVTIEKVEKSTTPP